MHPVHVVTLEPAMPQPVVTLVTVPLDTVALTVRATRVTPARVTRVRMEPNASLITTMQTTSANAKQDTVGQTAHIKMVIIFLISQLTHFF